MRCANLDEILLSAIDKVRQRLERRRRSSADIWENTVITEKVLDEREVVRRKR